MGLLFLSHAGADAALAEYIEENLREDIPGVDVFRTSRIGQIPGGKEWLAYIQQHLQAADRFLILLTPHSTARPWICFETGAAWARNATLVPTVAGGLRKEDVPEPLRSLQLLSLEDRREAAEIFRELGGNLREPVRFAAEVRQLGELTGRRALEAEGWEQLIIQGKRYAWDGPFDRVPDGRPFPMPDTLPQELRQRGFRPVTGIHADLMNEYSKGYALLYEIDDKGRKHLIVSRDQQVLLVKRDDKAV